MIDANGIAEIISTYTRHGWLLRRVLLSPALKEKVRESISHLINGAEVRDADLDAAWFSRPQRPGGVPWEIRHLSATPYALLENIDDASADFEDAIHSTENKLRETLVKNKSA